MSASTDNNISVEEYYKIKYKDLKIEIEKV